jgi:hypothetical protein
MSLAEVIKLISYVDIHFDPVSELKLYVFS